MATLTLQLSREIHSGTLLSEISGASERLASVCQACLASSLMFPSEEPNHGQQPWGWGLCIAIEVDRALLKKMLLYRISPCTIGLPVFVAKLPKGSIPLIDLQTATKAHLQL